MSLIAGIGSPQTVNAANGGKVYAYNNINETTGRVVANANPSRVSIMFHNPGASDIFIAPSKVQNTPGTAPTNPSDVVLTPSNAALGGCWRVFGNGGVLMISGECQGAWQALAVTGAGVSNALTVMESNV